MNALSTVLSKFSFLSEYKDKRVIQLGLLGFSAGLPLALIFGTLSLWLRKAGLSRGLVTFFSWAALGYSFKFIWSPLVDHLKIPLITSWLGQRRSWLLFSQIAIMVAILGMGFSDPSSGEHALKYLAVFAILLGFSSATQDIVIDAYRIECAPPDFQSILSAVYIAGYRVGMIVSGAGALFLVAYFGGDDGDYVFSAWRNAYICMAALVLIGMLTTISLKEPQRYKAVQITSLSEQLSLILLFVVIVLTFIFAFLKMGGFLRINDLTLLKQSVIGIPIQIDIPRNNLEAFLLRASQFLTAGLGAYVVARLMTSIKLVKPEVLNKSYVQPVSEFFSRYQKDMAILLLLIVGLYRVSDIVLGVIANVFYEDMGFSLEDIATVAKTYGLIATMLGGFLGGSLAIRYGVLRVLLLGAILAAGTNLLFILLSLNPGNKILFYLVITADNLSVGIASTAFIAFLSSLTNISFTAVQYAIFSSVMSLFPKLLGGYSGSIVDSFGYTQFFVFTTLLGVPIILMVLKLMRDKRFQIKDGVSIK